ncbi:MAG: TonB-dependent receptor [Bryobacteraceae bacterium]
MPKLRSRAALYLVAIAVTAACCYAQSVFSGNIQGVISDLTGAAIPSATIGLRNVDTGVTATATSSSSGNYRFSSLPPGNYVVSAELAGFRKAEIKVTLETNQTQGVNISMALATSTQTYNVTTEAPTLDTDENRMQATLTSQTVRDLPALNRNLWDVLAGASPGVVGTGTHGANESPGGGNDNFGTQTPDLSANGRSYTGNRVIVDGMDATSPVQNGNIIYAPPPDAVQEVSMQANSWDAENNLGSSIMVQVTTKSGTNQFHGTGSWLFTNQDLLARTIFTGSSGYTPFKRTDVVGTFGGPVVKNKTFFFANVESKWSANSSGNTVSTFESPQFLAWAAQNFQSGLGTKILTTSTLTGIATTGVATLSNGKPATAANYMALYSGLTSLPAGVTVDPSMPMLDTGVSNLSAPYNGLQYAFRVDQYIGSSDRIYGNYANDSFTLDHPNNRVGFSNHDIQGNWYAQANWTHTFSATLLNEMGFAANQVQGSNGIGGTDNVPQITVTGQSLGFNSSWGPGTYGDHNYNWREVLSWVRGAHTLKFGANGTHAVEYGDFSPVNNFPSFTFDNLIDLVQNTPYSEASASGALTYNPLTGKLAPVPFDGQENPWGIFAQDDWKAKSNLSFTFSMRWDDMSNHTPSGPLDQSGISGNLILGAGSTIEQQIADATVQTLPSVFAHSMKNNWSPRVGFAWDPSKRGVWSIRGGFGVFHDWVALGQSVDEMRGNPPGTLSESFIAGVTPVQPLFAEGTSPTYPFNYPVPTIPAGSLNAAGGLTGSPGAVWALDRNMKPPVAINYQIGLERQLPGKFVAGASYSGSRSYDGLAGINYNRTDNNAALIAGTGYLYPNPNFTSINYVSNIMNGSYNAAIFTLRRTVGRAFSFQTSYTLSRAMSDINANTRFDHDGGFNVPDAALYHSYYSDANWDVRNHFSFSGVYTVPGMSSGIGKVLTSGWEVSLLSSIQSGTPFWVDTTAAYGHGGDWNADGTNYDIPNAAANYCSGSYNEQSYLIGLFPSTAFTAPAAGMEGNVQRNSCRNPGMLEVDASVLKNTAVKWLGERGSLQIRFDFENVLNKVNLGAVDPNIADASFAKSTSQLLPRTIQVGARIAF